MYFFLAGMLLACQLFCQCVMGIQEGLVQQCKVFPIEY